MERKNTPVRTKKDLTEIDSVPLSQIRDAVEVTGPMTYNESAQAWNTIRLRSEILNEFPELREKRGTFTYKLLIPRNPEALKKHMDDAIKSKNILPIFLSFAKIRKED